MSTRTLKLTFLIAALAAIATPLVYFVHFWGGKLADAPEAWGAFGSYLGGVLGAAFAFLALLALLLTVRVQDETARVVREAAQLEREYLKRKERKEEWLGIITHAERQIEKQLAAPVYKNGVVVGTLSEALNYVTEEVRKAGRLNQLDPAYADALLKTAFDNVTVGRFGPVNALVHGLKKYLDELSRLLVEDDEEILSHYASSYAGILTRMEQAGMSNVGGAADFWQLTSKHTARRTGKTQD